MDPIKESDKEESPTTTSEGQQQQPGPQSSRRQSPSEWNPTLTGSIGQPQAFSIQSQSDFDRSTSQTLRLPRSSRRQPDNRTSTPALGVTDSGERGQGELIEDEPQPHASMPSPPDQTSQETKGLCEDDDKSDLEIGPGRQQQVQGDQVVQTPPQPRVLRHEDRSPPNVQTGTQNEQRDVVVQERVGTTSSP